MTSSSAAYHAVAVAVAVGATGDSMDRVLVRCLETLASTSVVAQLCAYSMAVHAVSSTALLSMSLSVC